MATQNILHHEKNTNDFYSIFFFEPKNLTFLCTIKSLSFNGNSFYVFLNEAKSREKKLRDFSYKKISWEKVHKFFLEILPHSAKNKNCFPLKLND
jgi:hypothetical protein